MFSNLTSGLTGRENRNAIAGHVMGAMEDLMGGNDLDIPSLTGPSMGDRMLYAAGAYNKVGLATGLPDMIDQYTSREGAETPLTGDKAEGYLKYLQNTNSVLSDVEMLGSIGQMNGDAHLPAGMKLADIRKRRH